jgi:hypothetical protein
MELLANVLFSEHHNMNAAWSLFLVRLADPARGAGYRRNAIARQDNIRVTRRR